MQRGNTTTSQSTSQSTSTTSSTTSQPQVSAKAASILNKMNPDFWENPKLIEKLNKKFDSSKNLGQKSNDIIVDREQPVYFFDDNEKNTLTPKTFSETEMAGKREFGAIIENEKVDKKSEKKPSNEEEIEIRAKKFIKKQIAEKIGDKSGKIVINSLFFILIFSIFL